MHNSLELHMNSLLPNSYSLLLAGILAGCLATAAFAQDDAQPELEIIEPESANDEAGATADDGLELIDLDRDYSGEDDEPVTDDEVFDGITYNDEEQQYQLIEDPEDEDIVEPPSQRETDRAEIVRLFASYKEAVGTRNFLEADTLAKQIIELSIKVFGIDSEESAKSLTNLAIAQHGNGEYEAAERNYHASIDIIERISDRLNESLVNPLKGLGATQLAMGRPQQARQTFQRAVHVSHVNQGPHNKDQIEVLESMAEIHMALGEHKEALNVQEKMYFIQARNMEPDSLDILPALKKQAHWQHRLQMYDRERVTWRRVIQIIERNYSKEDLRLIPPLTSLGKSYLFITPAEYDMQPEISVSSGEAYLRRANRIADTSPDSDWRIVESTLLSLGDYYVLSGRPNRASRIFAELWQILGEGDDKLRNRRDHLEKLNVLQKIYPPRFYPVESAERRIPRDGEFETGTVSYGFTIDSSGRPTDIMHIETLPPEFEEMRERVRRNIRHLVYRPRIVDGRMVETPEITYIHEFYYRPQDIPTPPEAEETNSR